jgi:hypothetical protein
LGVEYGNQCTHRDGRLAVERKEDVEFVVMWSPSSSRGGK